MKQAAEVREREPRAAPAPAIEVRKLVKSFGHQTALRGVDLEVAEGEFLTLFGPNGAGKTTLIRCVSSLTRPSAGTIRLRGQDLSTAATSLRQHIGLISHNPLLYGDLTADENLRFFARMYDLGDTEARIDAALDQVGLVARRRDPVRNYSRGMVQRLAIARAILHDPTIMLLDEPYTGLDLQAADMLRSVLQDLAASNRTVILTTHNLEQGLEMCDRAAILHRGKVAWEGPRTGLDLVRMKQIYRDVTRLA
ncbi:MAG: heme ABC exporter ATP-binding protein CcmA [Anaerolineae bacterium]|nr:heme ABC exporter ATP-binding protein CcmA [Anaerolineae bacterium]